MNTEIEQPKGTLERYLSPMGAWAFALGTAIGWGSLVVTSNTYLLQAGPWGSIFGLLVGAFAMVVVGRNYHYLINLFPNAGGAYTYSKSIFGHDFGFLTAWFLGLTYLAIFWANVTSLPLFARYFIGDMYHFGYMYTVFGYDVYGGEVLLSIAAIVLVTLICLRSRKAVMYAMVAMGILLAVGITVCFAAALLGVAEGGKTLDPGFLPDKNYLTQIALIACISPWAFIGFEGISQSVEEFSFPYKRTFRIMLAAIAVSTALYAFVILLSVTAFPPQYANWFEYISDLGSLSGIEALPPFYAAYTYMETAGVNLLMAALLALVGTSLFGNMVAISRLLFALARDSVLPMPIARVNRWHTPGNAILLVCVISLIIPFFGRTAIGWIVDVTTLGAATIYGLVSACTMKAAHARNDKLENVTGGLGIALMIAVAINLLLPDLLLSQGLESESYFLFIAWGILGFIVFRILLSRDTGHRFGRSVAVWTALLSLVMLVSFVWINQALNAATTDAMNQIVAHFQMENADMPGHSADAAFLEGVLVNLESASANIMAVAAALIAIASIMMLTNFSYMSKWAIKSEEELDITRNYLDTDALTGLPRTERFNEFAQRGAERIREGGEQPVAVALDLVGIRDYSADRGREASEQLLVMFADVLKEQFTDKACSRFAEDYFYAFASERDVDEKLHRVFENFKAAGEATLPVHVGAYICAPEDDIVEVGFDKARSACDLDKKTWQSHITWFNNMMSDDTRKRLYVLDTVDSAIENRWIRPYYQAVVDSTTGELCSEEALARWIDPEYGVMSPGVFIPVLEEAGLLHKVDLHIMKCVLEDFATKREHGASIVPVSVNISLRDLDQVELSDAIMDMVQTSGESPDLLRIEFTESAASDDPARFKREVDALRAEGFEVWMDDFGSGFSSLNSLKDFDFDVVKLDMMFLAGANSDKAWDVISGIADITHQIGMRSLAEGVETEEQARRLQEAGYSMLQGFYYAKPQSLESIIEQRGTR